MKINCNLLAFESGSNNDQIHAHAQPAAITPSSCTQSDQSHHTYDHPNLRDMLSHDVHRKPAMKACESV